MITEFKDIDSLDESKFSRFVQQTFQHAGWRVLGGYNTNAYIENHGKKFVISIQKTTKDVITNQVIFDDLINTAKNQNITNKILISNSYFDEKIEAEALKRGIELIDRDKLHNLYIEKDLEIGRDSIEPRYYQQKVITESIQRFVNKNQNRLLIEMATGLGKTYTAAHLVKQLFSLQNPDLNFKRVLFLAHQKEILIQSVTSFKNVLLNGGIGQYSFSVCFEGVEPENTDFVFGSFKTFKNYTNSLLQKHFDLVIVDESHHALAKTYRTVIEYFQPQLLVGLTATPFRADGKCVLSFFGGSDGHVGKYDLVWALAHKHLAEPKYFIFLNDLDPNAIKNINNVNLNNLEKIFFTQDYEGEAISKIEQTIIDEKIQNPKCIVFCKHIKHIEELLKYFNKNEEVSTSVHSGMSIKKRRENIRKFREGNYKYILVRDLFNEGIDIPETNMLVFLRDTNSYTVWLQQLGRGLRKAKGKEFVYVLDFVSSFDRIAEVKQLQEQVDMQRKEQAKKDNKSIRDEDRVYVNFSKSVIDILDNIKELRQIMRPEEQFTDELIRYYEDNNELPKPEEIEEVLDNLSKDEEISIPAQLSSIFNSYYGYLKKTFNPETEKYEKERQEFKNNCLNYIDDFYEKYKILPSFKAISFASQHNGLITYTEADIKELLHVENENELVSFISKRDNSDIYFVSDLILSDFQEKNNNETEEHLLFKKYSHVTSRKALFELSVEEKNEIRRVFKSEFRFLNNIPK
jgi:superfamily II DNA or RNA helicase